MIKLFVKSKETHHALGNCVRRNKSRCKPGLNSIAKARNLGWKKRKNRVRAPDYTIAAVKLQTFSAAAASDEL